MKEHELYGHIHDLTDRIYQLELMVHQPLVKFKMLQPNAKIPVYATVHAAGLDLYAANEEAITIFPDDTKLVPLGFAMELPPGFEAQIRPRSGLAIKGVAVANSPGTIDEDYRGEVQVIIRNHGVTMSVHKGDRIAQMVIARVAQAILVEDNELSETARGAGGFGSTGTK